MSKILVVATQERCPAVSALRSERLAFDLVLVEDEYTYGRTLRDYWLAGEEFINVEHDIVPWPGALQTLMGCPESWCAFDAPVGHSGRLGRSLGCVRFSMELMYMLPKAYTGWDITPWNVLDAQVYGALQIDEKLPPHRHWPPVAHLTDLKPEYGLIKELRDTNVV